MNRLFGFFSCLCAILTSVNSSPVVNEAHGSSEEIFHVSVGGFRKGRSFGSMSQATELDFAEAYHALSLKT